jgi:hypothetical protein
MERIDLFKVVQYSTWIITSSFHHFFAGDEEDKSTLVWVCSRFPGEMRVSLGRSTGPAFYLLLFLFVFSSVQRALLHTHISPPPRALVSVRGQSRVALLGTTITNERNEERKKGRRRREKKKKKRKTTAIVCSSPPAPHTLRVAIGTLVGAEIGRRDQSVE